MTTKTIRLKAERKNYNSYSTIKIDTSYPLRKKSVNFIDYFTPIASLDMPKWKY